MTGKAFARKVGKTQTDLTMGQEVSAGDGKANCASEAFWSLQPGLDSNGAH